ncbi:MAG: peptide deformylase [Ardenticatenaceae bacterium]|nr:peptide deformylase [Anaerolineales bacterium]MCB8917176.1 peptide deformylase [Ardenticatenaceae bacterium]
MTQLDIIQPNNPTLRKRARPVTRFDDSVQELIDNMIETMRAASGVGLAAPQVNQSLRLAVIETPPDFDQEGQEIEDSRELFVIINPEITWKSRKMVDGIEGCLSIPGYVGEVSRHEAVRVQALDRRGKKLNLRLKDWTARIFQHEIDHLNGVLYIDRLTDPENFWTEEAFQKQFADDDEEQPIVIEAD